MQRILHIIKDSNNEHATEIVTEQCKIPGLRVSVILVRHGAKVISDFDAEIYVLEGEASARGVSPKCRSIDYRKMLDLIFEHDSIIVW